MLLILAIPVTYFPTVLEMVSKIMVTAELVSDETSPAGLQSATFSVNLDGLLSVHMWRELSGVSSSSNKDTSAVT